MALWLRIMTWVTSIVGLVLLVLYVGFFDVWTVPADDPLLTAAIAPTLGPGDVVVVTRRTTVDRGNLLRCSDPQAAGRYVIARAMAKDPDDRPQTASDFLAALEATVPEATARLARLAGAGATWAVCAWPDSLEATAEAAGALRAVT